MINQYVHTFCRKAREAGITKLKFYLVEELTRELSLYQGELENLVRSELNQLFIEGLVEGKSGSVFVENLDEVLMDEHIRCILESAQTCNAAFIPYELEGLEQQSFEEYRFTDLEQTLEAMCRAEKAAYDYDSRVRPGVQVHVTETGRRFTLADEQERFATDVVIGGRAGIHLAVQEDEQVQPGGEGKPIRGDQLPDMEKLARNAAEGAVTRLGSGSYKTGSFPVVLDARVVGELLDAFMPAFFAKNIQSHMSVLEGRMGTQIAGENISILEDPRLVEGFSARRFDDEGVWCTPKAIVEKGILNCWLHNRQSAGKDGAIPGGNGFKGSFSETVSTGYTNVYIPLGSKTRQQLLEQMGEGLLITGVSGVFAGARPNSGDFSLISSGYRVENGQLGRGVTQITIAGNFFDMLKQVVDIANDEHWVCTASGNIRTPSLQISSLAISGKE